MKLIRTLAELCREHPRRRKVLVSPSFVVGRAVAEEVVRSGQSWVNVRVTTLSSLASDIAEERLARGGLQVASVVQLEALTAEACRASCGEGSYFSLLRDAPGLHRRMASTLTELRLAGIGVEDLGRHLGNRPKSGDLAATLQVYRRLLQERSLADRADVCRLALEELERAPNLVADSLFLILPDLDLAPVEREVLEKATGSNRILLPAAAASGEPRLQVGAAWGEENEVRALFRSLVASGTPLDQAEIVCVDEGGYAPILEDVAAEHGLPVTWSSGRLVQSSRVGLAVRAWLDWITSDYAVEPIWQGLTAGWFRVANGRGAEAVPASRVARVLRKAGIGWGHDRYRPRLEQMLANSGGGSLEEGATNSGKEWRTRCRQEVKATLNFCDALIGLVPAPDPQAKWSLSQLAAGANQLLEDWVSVKSAEDAAAVTALQEVFAGLAALELPPVPATEALSRLREILASTRFGASGTRPVTLHVAPLSAGGFSGRPEVYILGLDEGRFPGAGIQDPVLLDEERRALNRGLNGSELRLSSEAIARREADLQACLGRVTGGVTLSYSCRNLLRGRDQFPAAVLLHAYRTASGKAQATFEDLVGALGQPEGFVPAEGQGLNEAELWLRSGLLRQAGAGMVLARFPWLNDGLAAMQHREGDQFTVFDGNVGAGIPELDPVATQTVVSPTRLERLATCPFRYFLGDVLGLKPPEDLTLDQSRWLDPLEFGSLVHELLRRFLEGLVKEKRRPVFDRDWLVLERLAHESLEQKRQEVPASGDAAFNARRQELILLCRTFLKHEEGWCEKAQPRFFELGFGLVSTESDKERAGAEEEELPGGEKAKPVRFRLADGQELLLRGKIDRVDELDAGGFVVWDYKTGSASGFDEGRPLNRGRQLQHALYAIAVEQLLAKPGVELRVAQSGYFFPGAKGGGRTILFPPDPEATAAVLRSLIGTVRGGAFLPVGGKEVCGFCDFACVCSDATRVKTRAKVKLEASAGSPSDGLRDWRNLEEL